VRRCRNCSGDFPLRASSVFWKVSKDLLPFRQGEKISRSSTHVHDKFTPKANVYDER
jgi:hypothetical protein